MDKKRNLSEKEWGLLKHSRHNAFLKKTIIALEGVFEKGL